MIFGEGINPRMAVSILIYGAATTGRIFFEILQKHGLGVSAFIDQRADEIPSYLGLEVLSVGEAKERFLLERGTHVNGQAVVIVAVKNVFEHERIARRLYRVGFRVLLFRPEKCLYGQGNNEENALNCCYDIFQSGNIPDKIQSVMDFDDDGSLTDGAFLYKDGTYIVANIPFIYVYTDNYEHGGMWSDVPILSLLPHIGLFRFMSGTINEDVKLYMRYCRESADQSGDIVTSRRWEMSVYTNRMDVYNHMCDAWNTDKNFFVKNAVEGKYNEKGYFNIRSGKHRAAFLIAEGARFIPLRIRQEHYNGWVKRFENSGQDEWSIKKELPDYRIRIPHPLLYYVHRTSSAFYEDVLVKAYTKVIRDRIRHGYSIKPTQNERVLLIGTPLLLWADFWLQQGYEVYATQMDTITMKLFQNIAFTKKQVKYCSLDTVKRQTFYLSVVEDSDVEENKAWYQVRMKSVAGIEEILSKGEILSCGIVDGIMKTAEWLENRE